MAACLGLVVFALHLFLTPIQNALFDWPREVTVNSDNLYSFHFRDNWEDVQWDFGIDKDARMQEFEVEYAQNGQIRQMNFNLVASEGSGYIQYRFTYDPDEQAFNIRRQRFNDPRLHYDKLLSVTHFFSKLDEFDFEESASALLSHEGHWKTDEEAVAAAGGLK